MNKVSGSEYLIERTKENLFQVMDDIWCLTDKMVVAKLGQKGIKEKFDPNHWEQYIQALTGHAACPFCGAPTRFTAKPYQLFQQDGWICVENTNHYYLLATEKLMVQRQKLTIEQVREKTKAECEHHNLKFCCTICINAQIEKNLAFAPTLQVGETPEVSHE